MQPTYAHSNELDYQSVINQSLTSYGFVEPSETLADQLKDYQRRALLTEHTARIFTSSDDPGLKKQAARMLACAHGLHVYDFGISPVRACGGRFCSCCEGRAYRVASPYLDGLPALLKNRTDYDFHHLTLTLNHRGKREAATPVDRLRAEITRLKDAFGAFKSKLGTVEYIRKIEVSAENGMTNPHLHILACVPAGTLEDISISHLWKDATKLRFLPDVRLSTYQGASDVGHITRTARYVLKPAVQVTAGLLRDPSLLTQMATQLDGVRAVSASSLFRQYRTLDKPRSEPLYGYGDLGFAWSDGGYHPVDTRTGIRVPASALMDIPPRTTWVN